MQHYMYSLVRFGHQFLIPASSGQTVVAGRCRPPPPPVVAFIFIAHMVQIPLTVRRFASNVNVCRGERILPEIIDDLDRVCSPL